MTNNAIEGAKQCVAKAILRDVADCLDLVGKLLKEISGFIERVNLNVNRSSTRINE